MRMRFKKQLSALVAAAGLMTEKPTAYPAGKRSKLRGRGTRSPHRQHLERVAHTRHLLPRPHVPGDPSGGGADAWNVLLHGRQEKRKKRMYTDEGVIKCE